MIPPVVAKAGDIPAPATVDGNPETVWTADKKTDLTLDLGYSRDIGGLTLRWAKGQIPETTHIALSEDRTGWTAQDWQRYIGPSSIGTTGYLRTAEAFGRYVRLSLKPSFGGRVGLMDATVEPPEFGRNDNRFLLSLAEEAKKGSYPRSFSW